MATAEEFVPVASSATLTCLVPSGVLRHPGVAQRVPDSRSEFNGSRPTSDSPEVRTAKRRTRRHIQLAANPAPQCSARAMNHEAHEPSEYLASGTVAPSSNVSMIHLPRTLKHFGHR